MENMELKASFDLFRDTLANFIIQTFKNPGGVVRILQDGESREYFQEKHVPKDLDED